MRLSFVTRLKKLELARAKQGPNRIVYYVPEGLRTVSAKPGRWLLVPNFGSMAAWEAALAAQQLRLMNQNSERRS